MSAQQTIDPSAAEMPQERQETPEEQRRREAETAEAVKSALLDQVVRRTEEQNAEVAHFELNQRLAKLFATSGCFGNVKNKTVSEAIAEAFTKIAIGESMGFTQAQSMMGVDIIQGRPAINAALRASRMQQMGYDWQIDWLGTEENCTGCRLWLFFKGEPIMNPKRNDKGEPQFDDDGNMLQEQVNVAFTKRDAERMLTTISGKRVSVLEKDNWKIAPRNMYFARAVTNLQRFHVPKAISVSILSSEEALDTDATPMYRDSFFPTGSAELARAAGERKLREEFGVDPDGSRATTHPKESASAPDEGRSVSETESRAPKPSSGKPAGPAKPKFF